MSLFRLTSVIALASLSCFSGNDGQTPPPPGGDPTGPGPTQPPPTSDPPPPAPAVYKRGSLIPQYQLTPRNEQTRFVEGGVVMSDTDFLADGNNFTAASQKLDEIGAQIGRERGTGVLDLIPDNNDRILSQGIPFRGNPTDVKLIKIGNLRKAYVPLGGDLMTPGNEIASVNLSTGQVTRIKVGIHPQRIAIHPDNLVFVCNQFSNYISIIDATTDQPFLDAKGQPVEVKTEFYCTDLAFVPRSVAAPNPDEQDLYVANEWRGTVLKYGLTVVRDGVSNLPKDVKVTNPANPNPASQPAAEIPAGKNPMRLSVGQDLRTLFVANSRGGELARIDLASNNVRRIAFKAPAVDVVQANDVLLIPTTMPDRGLPDRNDQLPQQVSAQPVVVNGMDNSPHVAHPGAMTDTTKAYGFEDIRNGIFVIDAQLNSGAVPTYFTDDISPELNFQSAQKILKGSLPQTIVLNAGRTRAFVAMQGADCVQQFVVGAGAFRLADAGAALIKTDHRPYALALDEQNNELLVADWGGEVLEVFNAQSGQRKQRIDLGYATTPYPATNIERGEFLFYNTAWSNNGRKSCMTCHFDELGGDGVGFANGAAAVTEFHKIPFNWNLMTTDSYFWNGSFNHGTYASLAASFQTRTNCELIEFGFAEGIASNPNTRIGDPNDRFRSNNEANCRPQVVAGQVLTANFDQTAQIINAENLVRDQIIKQATGFDFETVSRLTDFYSVSELRLPPNPLAYLAQSKQLDGATAAKIDQGKALFTSAGCANCHDPGNSRHPYADGLNHGPGSTWTSQFVNQYSQDSRVLNILKAAGLGNTLPPQLQDAIAGGNRVDTSINVQVNPIDFFIPSCFTVDSCLRFEDPIPLRGTAAETQALEALTKVNLANADRGFFPGNVIGQAQTNTPSLRGIWFQGNYLRHGLSHSLKESVLAPGHPLLGSGENGFAIDASGKIDVHGRTSKMSKADFEALTFFVMSIE
jgi:cytochrome c peroxidase